MIKNAKKKEKIWYLNNTYQPCSGQITDIHGYTIIVDNCIRIAESVCFRNKAKAIKCSKLYISLKETEEEMRVLEKLQTNTLQELAKLTS